MIEKTDTELDNESVAFRKEAGKAQDQIDAVKREINQLRNELDELTKEKRKAIRAKEEEIMSWTRVKRENNDQSDLCKQQAWATRRMGA